MGWFSDFVSDPIGTIGDTGQKIISNPIPAVTAGLTMNPAALLGYAVPTGGAGQPSAGQVNSGLLSAAGSLLQNRSNVAGNTTAAQATQFRPVGITNTFGTSQFAVDPTTGQITSAGYTLSPQLQAAQNTLMGNQAQNLTDLATIQNLGRGYLAQTPQQAAQQYIQNQQALLAPGREQAWANLANQDYNRGTMGLKVAQGGGLQAANPYAAALANAQAQQDLQLAARAQQAGQEQTLFGQGLLSSAYKPFATGLETAAGVEKLGQSPFGLSTDLATKAALAGGNAAPYLKAAGQTNTLAQLLGGASTNPLLSSLFNIPNLNQAASSWMAANPDITPMSTFGGYGDVTDLAQYGVF
jgi:hypothetical protein